MSNHHLNFYLLKPYMMVLICSLIINETEGGIVSTRDSKLFSLETTPKTDLDSNISIWNSFFKNERPNHRTRRESTSWSELIERFPNTTDNQGNTLIHFFVIKKCSYCVTRLLAQSVDPNIKNHAGQTALNLAKSLQKQYPTNEELIKIIHQLQAKFIISCPVDILSSELNKTIISKTIDSKMGLELVETGLKFLRGHQDFDDKIVLIFGNTEIQNDMLISFITDHLKSSELYVVGLPNKTRNNNEESPIPKFFFDTKTNTKFYEIPGFCNSFEKHEDIYVQFFLKNILENVKQVKFLLTASQDSLENVEDFLNCLDSVIRLMPNIKQYMESISLVVANVDVDSFSTILELLVKIQQYELIKLYPNPAIIELINNILKKDSTNNSFVHLGFITNPDTCGQLNNSLALTENREDIRNLVFDRTAFITIDQFDFQYSIQEDSEIEIVALKKATILKIRLKFTTWFESLKEKYETNLKEIDDIQQKIFMVNKDEIFFDKFRVSLNSHQNLKHILSSLMDFSFYVKMPLQPNILGCIWDLNEFLEFLSLVSAYDEQSIFWGKELTNFLDFFDNIRNWYIFMNKTYKNLSSFKIQSAKSFYQTQPKFEPNKTFSSFNITFLKEISGFSNVESFIMNSEMCSEINTIFDQTLNKSINYSLRSNGIWRIEANFILISEILPTLIERKESAEIFAFDTIYIDVDIDLSETNRNLVILAPKWVIQGDRLINLNNAKLGEGTLNISNIESGKSGFLFEKSDKFFGFGETILNGINLRITSNHYDHGSIKRLSSGYPNVAKYKTLFLAEYQENYLTSKIVLDMITNVEKDNRNILETRTNDLQIELIDIENLHSTQTLDGKFFVSLYESLILKIIKYSSEIKITENEFRFKQLQAYLLTISSLRLHEAKNHKKQDISTTTTLQNIRNDINALKEFSNVENLIKLFDLVLDIISDIETELKGLSSSSIEQVVKDLTNSVNWYSFQIEAFKMLSSYEIQLAKQSYSGAYPKFEPEIDFSHYELPISKVNEKMSIELNTLVDHTSKSEIQVTIKNSIVQIKGNFIIVSKILRYVTEQNKSVELFAFDTIYIDADIDIYDGRDLAIISPEWVIRGEQHIRLRGKSGESYANLKAAKSYSRTLSGKIGRSGEFGGDSGNFLGFGNNLINSEKLHIISVGGLGGSGSVGGDGFDGRKATKVDIEHWKRTGAHVPLNKHDDINRNDQAVSYSRYSKSEITVRYFHSDLKRRVHNRRYTFYGEAGWEPSNGGTGGPGGGGGHPGYIFTSDLLSINNIFLKKGQDGIPGLGGNAGKPGTTNDEVHTVECSVDICNGSFTRHFEFCNDKYPKVLTGLTGAIGTITIKPKNSRSEQVKSSYKNLINYKISLLENIQEENRLNIEAILSLVRSMDLDSLKLDLFTTSELCTELLELENSYLNTYHIKLQTTVYSNFLSKVNSYASNPNPVERSLEFKKVLAFLFTAAYSRVHGNNLKPNVVTDIQSYFKLLKEKIQRLRNLKNYEEKLSIINQTLSEYKEPMDQKIDSGIKLINTRILPQIDYINKQLDKTIELLVDEVVELKKKAEIELNQLYIKEEELKSAASLRSLFSVLKVVGQAASFLGPKGKAVGALISGASTITESFVLDQKVGSFQQMQTQFKGLGQFSAGFQSSINSYTNKKINDLSLKIEKLAPATIEYPSLADLNSDIKQYKTDLDEIKKAREQPGANPYSYQNKVDELEDKLASRLDEKEQELLYKEVEDLEEKQKKNRENGAEVIRQVNNVVQMAELGVDIHHKHQKDKEAIQQVSKEIAKISEIIKGHEEFKKQIYSYMIPQLDNMKLINEKVIEGLSDLNQIELSVKKWEVQSHVKQMILKLKKFTKGSDLQGDFLHIMEELQDGLGVIVQVYDKIEEYQDQKQMFDFMALLASPASQQISITDKELSPQVSKLEYIIQANLLISLYNHGMGSFRQWVFPFGHRYLDQFNLPRSLILQEDFNDLVNQVVEKVTKVSEIIDILKSTISTPDNDITSGIFNSQIVSQGPFYVWDYDEWKENILDLVSGIDVIFKADVRNIPFVKNALKLSTIEINFNCTNCNEETKSELDHELKYFSVNMTHGGNSFYKCEEKYFIVRGESTISIKQSFEFHEKKRVLVNQVSSKLALGDCQLSPYTSWTFQLFSDRRRSFDKLKEIFSDHKINLELVGEGKYVLDGMDFSKLYLERYYEQV